MQVRADASESWGAEHRIVSDAIGIVYIYTAVHAASPLHLAPADPVQFQTLESDSRNLFIVTQSRR